MTIKEMQQVFHDISYPGMSIKVRPRKMNIFGMVKVDLDIDATDTRDPYYHVTLRRTFEVRPAEMTAKDAIDVAFQEIVRHLAHEAAEQFRYRGQILFDPHLHGEPVIRKIAESGL